MKVNPQVSKTKIYVILFVIVAALYGGYLIYQTMYKRHSNITQENFVDEKQDQEPGDTSKDYEARMNVMKVFELIMGRNPTSDEITKYSKFKNEQDILINVLKEHNTQTKKSLVIAEEETLTAANIHALEEYESVPSPDKTVKSEQLEQIEQVERVCLNKKHLLKMLDKMKEELDNVRNLVV
jgi:hypothetical protein